MFTSRLPCYAPVHLNKVDLPLPVLPTTLTRCPGVRFKQSLRRTKGMFSRYRKEMSCSAHLSPVVRNFIPTYRPTWWKPPRSEPKSIDLLRKLDWVVLFFTLELDGPMLGGGCVGFPKKVPWCPTVSANHAWHPTIFHRKWDSNMEIVQPCSITGG